MDSAAFKHDFFSEYNDALLVTYLASITQSQTLLNELIDKYNLTAGARGRPGRAMGMGGGMGGMGGMMGGMMSMMMGW